MSVSTSPHSRWFVPALLFVVAFASIAGTYTITTVYDLRNRVLSTVTYSTTNRVSITQPMTSSTYAQTSYTITSTTTSQGYTLPVVGTFGNPPNGQPIVIIGTLTETGCGIYMNSGGLPYSLSNLSGSNFPVDVPVRVEGIQTSQYEDTYPMCPPGYPVFVTSISQA
jgi:hypothetical protein